MIINEKALLRAMKGRYKGKGYHVAVVPETGREWMLLWGGDWYVRIDTQNIPRKILGYVAETVGALPSNGDAYRVSKGMVEKEQLEVEVLFEEGPEIWWKVKPTGLTMGGNELWQNCGTREILLMDPDMVDMIGDSRAEVNTDGTILYAKGGLSEIRLHHLKPNDSAKTLLSYPEKKLWAAV